MTGRLLAVTGPLRGLGYVVLLPLIAAPAILLLGLRRLWAVLRPWLKTNRPVAAAGRAKTVGGGHHHVQGHA